MDVNNFQKGIEQIKDQGFSFLQPIIEMIDHERFGGMTSINILKVLNLAAKSLNKEEIYLELGTYKGLTLIGAMLGNEDKKFIAVDDFSQYGGSEAELLENIHAFFPQGISPNFRFYQLSIEEFFKDCREKDIGMVFFDALHTYKAIMDYFWLVLPHLAESAILIFDDSGTDHKDLPSWVGEVWEATEELLSLFRHLKELAYFDPVMIPGWHLGLRILVWQG